MEVQGRARHHLQGREPGCDALPRPGEGAARPPLPYEAGWKDTVIALPGQVTRLMVRWSPTDVSVGGTGGDPETLAFPFDRTAWTRLRLALPHHRPRG